MWAEQLELSFGETQALRGANLQLEAGEVVAVMGPSGSGKSTLLHCLAGILASDRGRVRVGDLELGSLRESQRSDLRLRRLGFVLQFGGLVPELTLRENVALPLMLVGTPRRETEERVETLLQALAIGDVADRRGGAVSGGQAQRAAVARAVVHRPAVLFADEPTGALDTVTGELVLEAMLRLAREIGTTVLLVTHENRVAAHADRLVSMRDGRVVDAGQTP